jgi:hypothetical protein
MARIQSAVAAAKETIDSARSSIEVLARTGYAAKGIVYLIIGIMSIRFSIGERPEPGDFTSVLLTVFSEPSGTVLLALLTIGLIGYGIWCLVQAALDTENQGTKFLGIIIRVFYTGVGIVYFGVAWDAMRLLTSTSRIAQGDQSERRFTARLFSISSSTRWLAVVGGIGFVVFCVYEIRRLYLEGGEILKAKGHKQFIDNIAIHIGQIGIVSRAVLLAIIGIFLSGAA